MSKYNNKNRVSLSRSGKSYATLSDKEGKDFLNQIYDMTRHNDKDGVCCICGKPYHDYGHNAMPLVKGRCCTECNEKYIMSLRIALARRWVSYTSFTKPLTDKEHVAGFIKENFIRKGEN